MDERIWSSIFPAFDGSGRLFPLVGLPLPLREASLSAFALPVSSLAHLVRDKTALLARSTVGSFFLLPWLAYAAGSVEPNGCLLVRVAAQVLLAAMHGDVQNDNKLATTRDGLADVETAVL